MLVNGQQEGGDINSLIFKKPFIILQNNTLADDAAACNVVQVVRSLCPKNNRLFAKNDSRVTTAKAGCGFQEVLFR